MKNKRNSYLIYIVSLILMVLFAGMLGSNALEELQYTSAYIDIPIRNGVLFGANTVYYYYFEIFETLGFPILFLILGIVNIICGIKNRQNKKISFWQILSGICYILIDICIITVNVYVEIVGEDYTIGEIFLWGSRVIFTIIPIVLAIRNFILIPKNKPNKIQFISYILTIIVAIVCVFINNFTISAMIWITIASIILIIYIQKQENIEENKPRKIFNILFYYVLLLGLTIIITVIVLTKFIILQTNKISYSRELNTIYNQIITLKGAQAEEVYIPVIKNNKYGFIDTKGKELINCQYDMVSQFIELIINQNKYYVALVQKGTDFYIITKSNDKIKISSNKYINNSREYLKRTIFWNNDNKIINVDNMLYFYLNEIKKEIKFNNAQTLSGCEITFLQQKESNTTHYGNYVDWEPNTLYYENENYKMTLNKPNENYLNKDNINIDKDKKYNVTVVNKKNGTKTTTLEYLLDLDFDSVSKTATITLLSDKCIRFTSSDGTINGFYNIDGNKVSISSDYLIQDVKNGSILIESEKEKCKYLLNEQGNVIKKATWITNVENGYIIWDEHSMALYDTNLNKISNDYDKIIGSNEEDVINENTVSYKPYKFYKESNN